MRTGLAIIAIVAIAPITAGGIYGGNSGRAQDGWRWAQARQVAETPEPSPSPSGQSAPENPPSTAAPPAAAPTNPSPGTPAMVLDDQEVSTILGKSVRSNADEDMGRIVDIIVSRDGQVRAAIIDFGGFLGIGTRKIAVDWRALNFAPAGKPGTITVDLTRNQVRLAPEYKRGEPVVVVSSASPGRTTPSSEAAAPER
jgi:PRC-barrel domain